MIAGSRNVDVGYVQLDVCTGASGVKVGKPTEIDAITRKLEDAARGISPHTHFQIVGARR
jgi:hypothetical protein